MKAERFRQGLEDAVRVEMLKYKDYADSPVGWATFESVISALFDKYRIQPKEKKNAG